MRTRRVFLNRLDPTNEPTDAVVVIDVLRSFTTAAYAFAAGVSPRPESRFRRRCS